MWCIIVIHFFFKVMGWNSYRDSDNDDYCNQWMRFWVPFVGHICSQAYWLCTLCGNASRFFLKGAMVNTWLVSSWKGCSYKRCSSSYGSGSCSQSRPKGLFDPSCLTPHGVRLPLSIWGKQPTQFLIVILGLTQLGPLSVIVPFLVHIDAITSSPQYTCSIHVRPPSKSRTWAQMLASLEVVCL